MDEKALIDVFQLCWDVIIKESSMHGFKKAFFDSQHFKIIDTTDTNFDILENRLAYTYKYGCYNILFFEKCFLNFLNECSEFETVFPLKKLKVCSLSNGPGFDIIGLLCALYKSNKPLSSFPILNTVNMYHSWLSLYEMLIHKAYEIINLKITKFIPIKKENVNLIQGDIFSTLSPEVKQCISNSNVLLMVKVFFSSKATVNKFARSLQVSIFVLRV